MPQHDVRNRPNPQFIGQWKIPANTAGASDAIPVNRDIHAGIADAAYKAGVISINRKGALQIKWHISTQAIPAAQGNHLQVGIVAAAVSNG